MAFEYNWKNKEANFGPPLQKQVGGGTHVSFEIVLKKDSKYIALRRPNAVPEHELPPHAGKFPVGLLYFCHNLIRYGETVENCIKRIIKFQAGVSLKSFKIAYIDSSVQSKDKQWAIIPVVIAEVDKIPKPGKHGNEVNEIVVFDKSSVPKDFAWWKKKELEEFLEEYD